MLQDFVSRPHAGPGLLPEKPEDEPLPDLGLRQNVVELGGYEVTRTVTGIRFHKCKAIAVPKRRRYSDDLDGNVEPVNREPVLPFKFKEGPGPIGHVAQLRDEAWWIYNKMFPQRFLEKEKDWHVPDEATCPAIQADSDEAPAIGGHYREFPSRVQVAGAIDEGGTYNSDAGNSPRTTVQGDSFIDLNDDGSIVLKLSLIHISEPTRPCGTSRMPSSA